MSELLYFLLVGLGAGAFYAMVGSGIIVAYRGSGVINFAHGALAMYAVFTFTELRTTGGFFLPWFDFLPTVNLPVHFTVTDDGLGFWPSVVGMLLMSVVLGLLVHFLVFRPLRNASPLGKVVGSVGVLVYLQGVAVLHFGTNARQLEQVFPGDAWRNFLGLGRPFRQDALWAALAAVIIGLILWGFFRYTRFGLATRAAAENDKGAVLLGHSPELLAGANWVIASVLAGLAGLLVGPLLGSLDPTRYTLFIVPALAAALAGGLTSVLFATMGGLMIGMAETGIVLLSQKPWFPDWGRTGVKETVPLLVIAGILFLRGKALPARGAVQEQPLPLSPYPVRVVPHAIIWPVVAVVAASIFTGPWAFAFTTSLIAAILLLSYVVLTGYLGQISFAQLALAGTAAFVMVRAMSADDTQLSPVTGAGLPMFIALPIGVAAAVVVGLVMALPALRIRGVQLAVITIAAALALENLYFKNPKLTGLTGGSGAPVPEPDFFGIELGVRGGTGLSDNFAFSVFAIITLTLCALLVTNIRRTLTGKRFLAVRANERAAAAAGIDVARTKLLGFGIAAALAGIAGCMFAFQQANISSANWVVFAGLGFLAYAYIGGITSVNGAIIGGVLGVGGLMSFFGRFHFPQLNEYTPILGGIGLVLVAIIHPDGVAPFFQPAFRSFGNALVHWGWTEWRSALIRLGPSMIVGAVLGWVFWARQDQYSLWMVALGAGLALGIRSLIVQFLGRWTHDDHHHGPTGATSAQVGR